MPASDTDINRVDIRNVDIHVPVQKARRSRFLAKPSGGLVLGPRDEELLVNLFQHQVMTRSQIQELYFGSVQRCNMRLRQLFDHGFVGRYYPPVALWGAQAIYSAGKAAVPLVARKMEIEEADARRQIRNHTPTFLEHTLAIVQFYLSLRLAVSERPGVEIERWLPEMLARHEYEMRVSGTNAWRQEVFKPDGFVRLVKAREAGRGEEYHSFFLEIDLGHTSSRQFGLKLLGHHRYVQVGLFTEMFGCNSFKTLVVTTGSGRLSHLLSQVEEEQSDLFWFTTFDEIREVGILGQIWRRPFGSANVALVSTSNLQAE